MGFYPHPLLSIQTRTAGTILILAYVVFLGASSGMPGNASAQTDQEGSSGGCARVFDAYAVSSSERSIQLTLILDKPLDPKVFALENPPRLVLDLQPTTVGELSRLRSWSHPILRGPIRTGWQADIRRLRIVLDLLENVHYNVAQDLFVGSGQLGEGGRIILTVTRRDFVRSP